MAYAGQGDPARTIALLWRGHRAGDRATDGSGAQAGAVHPEPAVPAVRPTPDQRTPRSRGPRPSLTVDEIVVAAVTLADEGGTDAVSMRAVGQRLGRTGMALYTYVPGKAELLDLMYDHVHLELLAGLPDELGAGGRPAAGPDEPWRADVRAWVDVSWAFFLRHPWTLDVSVARPVLGPHEYAVLDRLATAVHASGLRATTARRLVSAVHHLVRATARTAVEARDAGRDTATSDTDYWAQRASALSTIAPDLAARYPASAWLAGRDEEAVGGSARAWDTPGEAGPLELEARAVLDAALGWLLDGAETERTPR